MGIIIPLFVMGCQAYSVSSQNDEAQNERNALKTTSLTEENLEPEPIDTTGLAWGEPVHHIQTAIRAKRAPKTKQTIITVYARNTSDQKQTVDAQLPCTNRARFLLYNAEGEKIGKLGIWLAIFFNLVLPPERVLSWEGAISNCFILADLKEHGDGRYMLTWRLQEAESPPLYLSVDGNWVTVYEDRWETVDFRFRLDAQKDEPEKGAGRDSRREDAAGA